MISYKFIKPNDPFYPRERALRWEMLHKPMGLPPGAEVCPEDEQGLHLVALEKKEVIGCILFYPDSEVSGKVVQMALAELHDHQGFARQLLHHLENYLSEKGFKEIACVVKPENLDLFQRLGFHKSNEEHPKSKLIDNCLLHKKIHVAS